MALRTSMVRFTDSSRVFAFRSYTETVDGDEPPATTAARNDAEATRESRTRDAGLVEVGVQQRIGA